MDNGFVVYAQEEEQVFVYPPKKSDNFLKKTAILFQLHIEVFCDKKKTTKEMDEKSGSGSCNLIISQHVVTCRKEVYYDSQIYTV